MTDPCNQTEGRYYTRSAKKARDLQTTPGEATLDDDLCTACQQEVDQGHSSTERPVEPLRLPSPKFLNEKSWETEEDKEASRSTNQYHLKTIKQEGEQEFMAEMAENSKVFGPESFSGSSKEDLNKFLQNFELWATFRRYDEPTKLSALPLLLKEGASIWYSTLRQGTKEDYDRLKAALYERYGPNQNQSWKNVADLWKIRQEAGQSFDDYMNKVEREANRLNCPAETTFMVAMNGLRPIIRQMVTIQNPSTIEDLKKLGRLVEDSAQDASGEMQETLTELRGLAGQLKSIQLQAFQPQSSTESAPSQHPNRPWAAENRGRYFQSTRFRWNAPRGHGRSYGQPTSANQSWPTRGRGHGQPRFRGQASSSPTRPGQANSQQNQRGYSAFRGRPNSNFKLCYACGQPGHVQSQCLSVRYQH